MPVSFETYGRLGVASQVAMRRLATKAAQFHNTACGLPALSIYARWRLEHERVLLYENADVVLLCRGHSSGVHALHRQKRPR